LIGSFVLGSPIQSLADTAKPVTPSKVEESSLAQDKAALEEAASEADKWAASHKTDPETTRPREEKATTSTSPSPKVPKSPSPGSSPSPSVPPTPSVSTPPPPPIPAAALPGVTAPKLAPRRQGLNEMKGKLLSISYDPRTLRLIVDGGYNVEFTFDPHTSLVNGGEPIKFDDLGYNDVLVVRYSGKELYAIEIERVSKAPRPE
jgi:hypothetical protein